MSNVTFCFINCNRLHYLKSSVLSLFECTNVSPANVVIIDNASQEMGTKQFLDEMSSRGVDVVQQATRDPSTEFPKALNIAFEKTQTEYIALLPADMQFVAKGKWLDEFLWFMELHPEVGSIVLDAQRRVTHDSHRLLLSPDSSFFYDVNRYKVSPWGSLARKSDIAYAYPWDDTTPSPELSSLEDRTMQKINESINMSKTEKVAVIPKVPVAITIWNDEGHQAKVRLDKRYGKYVAPVDGTKYYEMYDYEITKEMFKLQHVPASIEQVAVAVGWNLPLDQQKNWIKVNLNIDNHEKFVETDF